MHTQSDAIGTIRGQLCQTVERLQTDARRLSDAAIVRRMSEIERVAKENGLVPLARIARCGLHAIHGSGPRAALASYLERMEDAIGCGGQDDGATAAIMASIAIRLR